MKNDRPLLGGVAVTALAMLLTLLCLAVWNAVSSSSNDTNDAVLDARAASGG